MPQFAFFEGQLVPISEARISIMSHAFNYGTGCFEGIRAYWNDGEEQLLVFRMPEHYQRLHQSARILHIDLARSVAELCEITVKLLRHEAYRQDTYIRPVAYKSSEGIGAWLHGLQSDFAVFAIPFGRYVDKEEGADVRVSSWRRNADNAIPARAKVTGAYVNSALAKTEAVLDGYDEAIVLNENGHVSEGSAENLFIVRQQQLITPPVTENILEGITRATIIQLARERLSLETVERPIDRTELYVADEAFFCGTGVQVAAITSIDRRSVGSGKMGPIVRQIRDLYFRVVRGQEPEYRHWCTPVYER